MSDELAGFVTDEWLQKFMAELKQHPYAESSLSYLEAEGVSRADLLRFLSYYSHPYSAKYQRDLRSWAGNMAKLMDKAERWMNELADHLRERLPATEFWPTAWRTEAELRVIHRLGSASEQTLRLRQHYQRISSQKGRARDEESLVYVCLSIEATTKRPHWEDLAYLLEAAFLANGQEGDWNEDSVRKIVERFKKSHPGIYGDMMACLLDDPSEESQPDGMKPSTLDVPSEKPQPPATKRSTRNRREKRQKSTEPIIHKLHV